MCTFQYLLVTQVVGKALLLFNIKFFDITDMFNKCKNRSPKVFCKIGVLDRLATFTRKNPGWNLFLKKLQAISRLKRDLDTGVFQILNLLQ